MNHDSPTITKANYLQKGKEVWIAHSVMFHPKSKSIEPYSTRMASGSTPNQAYNRWKRTPICLGL